MGDDFIMYKNILNVEGTMPILILIEFMKWNSSCQ